MKWLKSCKIGHFWPKSNDFSNKILYRRVGHIIQCPDPTTPDYKYTDAGPPHKIFTFRFFLTQSHLFKHLSPWGIFCNTSSEGGLLQPPPWIFYTERFIPLYLLPVYRYGHPLSHSIDTKMSTTELHMTSLWGHRVSPCSQIWMYWKYVPRSRGMSRMSAMFNFDFSA